MRYVKQIKVGKIPTSEKEVKDLIKAWLAISFAVGIILSRNSSMDLYTSIIISSITVGTAFLFHEIAHKIVAQRYGCFAEFRSFNFMLILAVLFALIGGFIFIAPGAVIISGPIGRRRNGKISAAGPMTNIVLALIFLVLLFLNTNNLIKSISIIGLYINSFLAMFNLIPLGILDGKKILAWNKPIFYILLASSILLFFMSSQFSF